MFSSGQYEAKRLQLSKGDTLLLYTDGLSEAVSESDAEYGTGRLSKLVGSCHALPPQALIRACLEDLAAFRSGAPKRDDLTVMAIRRVA
jgi:sigma-B regulation protein RsbU (phosphoserine phosphatase)